MSESQISKCLPCHPSLHGICEIKCVTIQRSYPMHALLQRGSCLPGRAGSLSTLGVARFCARYPAVLAALQRSLLELLCKFQKAVLGCAGFI